MKKIHFLLRNITKNGLVSFSALIRNDAGVNISVVTVVEFLIEIDEIQCIFTTQ